MMLPLSSRLCFVFGVLVAVSSYRLVVDGAATASYIQIVSNDDVKAEATVRQKDSTSSSLMTAQVEIDKNDLFNMPSFSFTGMSTARSKSNATTATNVETAAAVYVKSHSTRRRTTSGTVVVTWHGSLSDNQNSGKDGDQRHRIGFATIMRYSGGGTNSDRSHHFVATFSTESTIYEIGSSTPGTGSSSALRVTTKLWKDVIDGEGIDVDEEGGIMASPRVGKIDATTKSFVSLSMEAAVQPEWSVGGTVTTSLGRPQQQVVVQDPQRRTRQLSGDTSNVFARNKMRSSATVTATTTVDVLVLVTNRAMCEVANGSRSCTYSEAMAQPILDKIALAQEQTNAAMVAVGIPVTIRIVEIIHLNAAYDANPDVSALETLRTNAQVLTWINAAGADLVAMMTGSIPNDFPAAGSAYIDRPESVISVDYLSSYTFTHEIGHNFGCRHNRGACPSSHPYGHALQVRNQFRTVMAYQCDVYDSCPRIPFYSAQGYFYNGMALGDATQDNARLIRERAARVAAWKPTVYSSSSGAATPRLPPQTTSPPAPVPTPQRFRAPVKVPMPTMTKAPARRRATRKPVASPTRSPTRRRRRRPPVEPPQQNIVPAPTTTTSTPGSSSAAITCDPSGTAFASKCPGANLMHAVTTASSTAQSPCTEYCVGEAFANFWMGLGRSCGPCVP